MRISLLSCLAITLASLPARAEEKIPPAPASHVLDQANVLLPEAAAKLSEQLLAAKRNLGIEVFLVTIPSLNSRTTEQVDKLQSLATNYSKEWTGSSRGAVIAFDDESGLVTVDCNKNAEDTYSALEINQRLRNPLLEIQHGVATRQKALDRDKLERTVRVVVDTFTIFEEQNRRRERKLWMLAAGVAFVVLIAVGFEVLVAAGHKEKFSDGDESSGSRAAQ